VVKVIWQQAASPPYMDGSVVIATLHQCAPHLIHASLGPSESSTQVASWSVQPFLHKWQSIPILYNGQPFPPQNCPSSRGSGPHLTRFFGPIQAHNPNCILISLAIFVEFTTMTDWPTDHATWSITIDCIYVHSMPMRHSTSMRPRKWTEIYSPGKKQ